MHIGRLNRQLTFANFIPLPSNESALRLAGAVAACSGKEHGLLILAGASAGKTHLLHAIGNALASSRALVACWTGEDFLNNAKPALRSGRLADLRD